MRVQNYATSHSTDMYLLSCIRFLMADFHQSNLCTKRANLQVHDNAWRKHKITLAGAVQNGPSRASATKEREGKTRNPERDFRGIQEKPLRAT